MQTLAYNIKNMLECRPSEHCLFRSYGLGGEVDGQPITRSQIRVELARWYPQTRLKTLKVDSANGDGSFAYSIEVAGV